MHRIEIHPSALAQESEIPIRPSDRPHYVRKVAVPSGEVIWHTENLADRAGAVRVARREAMAHRYPMPIVREWLDGWEPIVGDPRPFRDFRVTCDAIEYGDDARPVEGAFTCDGKIDHSHQMHYRLSQLDGVIVAVWR